MSRRILVTSALPNANGPIHLGHVLEQIQTDIWVRFQRMRGNQAIYVCADDTHGTATMIKAEQEGVSAETLVENMRQLHVADSQGFLIAHDNYYSTHSPENQRPGNSGLAGAVCCSGNDVCSVWRITGFGWWV